MNNDSPLNESVMESGLMQKAYNIIGGLIVLESLNCNQPTEDTNVYLRVFIYSLYWKLLILQCGLKDRP